MLQITETFGTHGSLCKILRLSEACCNDDHTRKDGSEAASRVDRGSLDVTRNGLSSGSDTLNKR